MSLESALTLEGHRLLRLARETIVATLQGHPPPGLRDEEQTEGLRLPLGAFVTLYRHGELRGCIGRMQFDTPLYRNVLESAVSSAFHDPRFTPLIADELTDLRIEISVLDEPQPIERVDQFDIDQHGIVMELGSSHGVFLPKVAREYGWDREKTLTMLCRKIGLAEQAWQNADARFKVFRAREFVED